jgi:hypothetical protein
MGVIKNILRGELENLIKQKRVFENELYELPAGSLCRFKRSGFMYYYLKVRRGNKVRNLYKGKIKEDEMSKFKKVKSSRRKLRRSLSEIKKKVKYLRSVLRGKTDI